MVRSKSHVVLGMDTISIPVMAYPHASSPSNSPCEDLYHNARRQQGNETPTKTVAPQCDTAHQRGSHEDMLGADAAIAFDFRVSAPPDEVFPSKAGLQQSPQGVPRIGLALGSPRMLDHRDELPPPQFKTEIFTKQAASSSLLRKSSKWRKIGGLFKAKHALTTSIPDAGTSSRQASRRQQNQPGLSQMPGSQFTDEWPKFDMNSQLGGAVGSKNGLLLEVDIPAAQMERYSVMFGQVMKQNNQRPSLLTRRSKTLDSLRLPDNEAFLSTNRPPVPQRRATSPARSNFTLFPSAQPTRTIQRPGTQNFSRGPSPLPRSSILPVESPSSVNKGAMGEASNALNGSPSDSAIVPRPFASPDSLRRPSLDTPLPTVKPEPRVGCSLPVSHQARDNVNSIRGDSTDSGSRDEKLVFPNVPFTELGRPSSSTSKEKQLAIPIAKSRRRSYSLGPPRTSATASSATALPGSQDGRQFQSSNIPIPQTSTPPHQQQRKASLQTSRMQYVRSPNPSPSLQPTTSHRQPLPRPTESSTSLLNSQPKTARPELRIATNPRTRPPLQMIGGSSSTSLGSRTHSETNTMLSPSVDPPQRAKSPTTRALSPWSAGSSPSVLSPRMPLATDPDEIEDETGPETKVPVIEVSIARSVSVSRAKRQVLVPVGARVEALLPKERVIERGPMMPRIMDTSIRSKHAVSQHLRIELLE
ncbi:hypothetical protein PDE_01312 [Penicillium oxalicum 114-2]|uniref:Uncharacterized protein n=1 Tax=Penicillium oxalicum (strain 114-2 / CGMCC 5302) TaxID=933388 RepID=S7ZCG0_PENO1|nr:hypothetical protein PDE_01312 [Penicillium oxalicum 114-2]